MYNILVCDDEKDIVSALRIYLTAEGYRVFEAGNGAEALEVIDREDIHLALLDVMMPGMDGITALNRLREHHNLPVILLTAKSEDTDKVLGLNVGADDYVTKPFNPVELLARVRSQLRRYLQLGGGQPAPSAITVGAVLRLTEGSLAPVACLEKGASPCERAAECRTLPLWSGLNDVINEYLDRFTISDLVRSADSGFDYVI